jgi:glycosyltransferase involved in cell wall biosynthesis
MFILIFPMPGFFKKPTFTALKTFNPGSLIMKRLVFTVTNELTYDQRMIRICSSLAAAGYAVTLVGVKRPGAASPPPQSFIQKRLPCFFQKGKGFYIEYNIRLFFYLLFKKCDCICSIDLDTILAGYYVSKLKGIPRIYDAHELFCEMKEVVTRPRIYRVWKKVEGMTVPNFKKGYTVNGIIAGEFQRLYGVEYEVIRNAPVLRPLEIQSKSNKYILYQGAVNEGRSFETLIPAMQWVPIPLIICGDGNFMQQAQTLVKQHGLEQKVIFKGKVLPQELRSITEKAWIGLTFFENKGQSNYWSLANRFFDYIHAGVPQLCVDYPVYREINNKHRIAVLMDDLSPEAIARGLNSLLNDQPLYDLLQRNCLAAREEMNWQEEEKKLLAFYKNALG